MGLFDDYNLLENQTMDETFDRLFEDEIMELEQTIEEIKEDLALAQNDMEIQELVLEMMEDKILELEKQKERYESLRTEDIEKELERDRWKQERF